MTGPAHLPEDDAVEPGGDTGAEDLQAAARLAEVDAWCARLVDDQRAAIEHLRPQVRAVVPDVVHDADRERAQHGRPGRLDAGQRPVLAGAERHRDEHERGEHEQPDHEPPAEGEIGALIISGDEAGNDPRVADLAARARFVLTTAMFQSDLTAWSHLVLPGTSYLEREGTMVNLEGRAQRLRRAVVPTGPDELEWLSRLGERFGE